ncbi:MAG TPA: PEP-CTERM sorting domain-containing protein [Gemmataceae bacterium]|nr:PEP-CTERM sorting domain-containing protein [Gemmataceae bacterium]
MRRSLLFFASTAGLLCLAATQARADQSSSNIAWSYNFTPNQTFVSAASPGTGTVSFTNEPTKNASGSSDVVVTNLKVSSTAPAGTPDTFGSGGAWKVGLVLSDAASGTNSGTLWFTGQLGGNFSSSNSNVTSTFTGTTTYHWTAGNGTLYTVSLTGYTPPGPPTASNAGSISAHVTVQGPVISGSPTPEPSSMVLACLGLTFAGAASWRKRRRTLAAMLA